MERAGLADELVELELGDSVPQTKNVLLDEGDTHLELLSDRITWGSTGPVPVFSVGDAIIGIGLIVVLVEFLFPMLQRPHPAGSVPLPAIAPPPCLGRPHSAPRPRWRRTRGCCNRRRSGRRP